MGVSAARYFLMMRDGCTFTNPVAMLAPDRMISKYSDGEDTVG